ncbi:precorrin-3B synthase [Corynebacterium sp. sy039]|uniref:precorrin-3B synthase n=1 Tax=Corynebacterium sp. sy039 TaxID=2599641 RepID=UPI001FEFE586|nr:precorrin-3B synthase [Corynebacterium sp. sy039]
MTARKHLSPSRDSNSDETKKEKNVIRGSRTDRCPGAHSLHQAADGYVGRLRFPGGLVQPENWETIHQLAAEHGDSHFHLTSRGNVQIRGIKDPLAFSNAVSQARLVPSKAHDRLRNIIASPFSTQLWEVVAKFDAALLANDEIVGLPGRILFGFDSGEGDILSQKPDFGMMHFEYGSLLILGGELTRVAIDRVQDSNEILLAAAVKWQQERAQLWRVHEHDSFSQHTIDFLVDTYNLTMLDQHDMPALSQEQSQKRRVGWFDNEHGSVTLGFASAFGQYDATIAQILAAIGAPTTVTPWASVIVHDVSESVAEAIVKVLAPMGMIFDEQSPWLSLSACTGLPGCTQALSNVRHDAAAYAQQQTQVEGLVHFSGCQRRCGHPLDTHTEFLAISDAEYEVSTR